MKVDMKLIDDLIENINSEIDSLTIQLNRLKTELRNMETEKKELDLQLEDEEKIIHSLDHGNVDSHAAFSPYASEVHQLEITDIKKEEIKALTIKQEMVTQKLHAKEMECNSVIETINIYVDHLTYMEEIKRSIKRQVDDCNNEYFVKELKEIVQKKRLIKLEKTKYSSIISKLEQQVLMPSNDMLKQMQLAMSFLQTDPVRARQEFDKVYKQMADTVQKTDKLIKNYSFVEPNQALCDLLNSYIGNLVQIYSDIKFNITVANLKQINNVSADLNRCLMDLFKGLINSFILKCAPTVIYLRFAYDDGYLNITGKVNGNYINFYNEMKNAPSSIIGNMYERVFLLNGSVSFKDNKDGSFHVNVRVPIKNYLS